MKWTTRSVRNSRVRSSAIGERSNEELLASWEENSNNNKWCHVGSGQQWVWQANCSSYFQCQIVCLSVFQLGRCKLESGMERGKYLLVSVSLTWLWVCCTSLHQKAFHQTKLFNRTKGKKRMESYFFSLVRSERYSGAKNTCQKEAILCSVLSLFFLLLQQIIGNSLYFPPP